MRFSGGLSRAERLKPRDAYERLEELSSKGTPNLTPRLQTLVGYKALKAKDHTPCEVRSLIAAWDRRDLFKARE